MEKKLQVNSPVTHIQLIIYHLYPETAYISITELHILLSWSYKYWYHGASNIGIVGLQILVPQIFKYCYHGDANIGIVELQTFVS